MELQHLISNLANSPIRRETLHGRSYVVAPMAMLTAGVHNGSNGALLYEEDDIAQAVPAWNMKPIVVYHPTINNNGISAADPDVLERQQVGMVLNTTFASGKLRAEAWIEEELANNVDERVMEALDNNNMMEVSTGLFTTNEAAPGTWNNATTGEDEEYVCVARNHQPDHLALLPDQIGACSIADGAGLLQMNAESSGIEGAEVMQVARRIVGNKMSHSNIWSALGTALREKVPPKKKGVGDDSYTVGPWVIDVYDKFFIYELDGKLFRLHYTSGKAGVEITGDEDEVVRVTEYRTAETGKFVGNAHGAPNQTNQPTNMKKEEIVDGLINNADTQWGKDDRETLMGLDEAVLNKMVAKAPVDNNTVTDTKPDDKPEDAPDTPDTPTENTAEDYINNAPPEIQQVLRNGLAAHETEQKSLIKKITGNTGNTFTEEFLATKGLDELRGIAALAGTDKPETVNNTNTMPPMFVGQSTPASPTGNTEGGEEALAAPVMNFGSEG